MSASSSSASPCRRPVSTTPSRASTSCHCSSTPRARRKRRASCRAATVPTRRRSSARGRSQELLEVCLEVDADTVVFDNELTPAQQFNLEKLLGRTAIDRTAVILDIFAQNAHTLEGKAQVELALLRYRLPRLRRGRAGGLSQQAGRIGTRGPGETQLETDRRRLQRRITKLEQDLKSLGKTRHTQRKARTRSRMSEISIVGYTNAGKSTLLNRLTDAGVLVENRLFATLDPSTKRLELPGGEPVLVSDTVGFVRKLPHQLVEAFKSTLETVASADLLVHVVDASSPDPDGQIDAVRVVLREIEGDRVPELIVFNKIDIAKDADRLVESAPGLGGDLGEDRRGDRSTSCSRSATGCGRMSAVVELVIPYERGDVLAELHREGEIVSESHDDDGVRVRARLDPAAQGRLAEFAASTP